MTDSEVASRGETVDQSKPCTKPPRQPVLGKHVELRPWDDAYAGELFNNSSGPGAEAIHEFLAYGPVKDAEELRDYLHRLTEDGRGILFAIIDLRSGQCAGNASLSPADVTHRTINAGIMLGPVLQKTIASTEVWYLLAKTVFDLGFRRIGWTCDTRNLPSRRAAVRFGFSLEGIMRQHRIIKGRNRDTAMYSVLDTEWPLQRLALEKWMDPDNYDTEGKQKQSLSAIRTQLAESGIGSNKEDDKVE